MYIYLANKTTDDADLYYWHENKSYKKWIKYSDSNQDGCTPTESVQSTITQNLEIYPQKYAQLLFDKGVKATQWKKDGLFNKGAGATGHS